MTHIPYTRIYWWVQDTANCKCRPRKVNLTHCWEGRRDRVSMNTCTHTDTPSMALVTSLGFTESMWGPKEELYHLVSKILQKYLHLRFFFFLVPFLSLSMNVLFFPPSSPHGAQTHRLHSVPLIFFCSGLKIPDSFIVESKLHYPCYLHIPSRYYIHPERLMKNFFWTNIGFL